MATGNYIRFDWAIKRLLRDKANFDILNGLLSTLLDETITIRNLLESEGNQEDESSKFNRVDLLAEDSRGELIIVEVQNSHEVDYWQRVLYGSSKVITDYIHIGEDYKNVRKVYSVNIIYFHIKGGDYVYHGSTEFRGLHTDEELELSANQQKAFGCAKVGYLYPEYYILCVEDFDKVAKTPLDEWISYLKTSKVPADATAPGLDAVRNKLRYDSLSPEEKKSYDRRMDGMWFERNVTDSYYAEGMEVGLEKGEAKGKLSIARKMKALGLSIDIIVKSTNLSESEIDAL